MNSNNDTNKTFIANFGVAYMNPFSPFRSFKVYLPCEQMNHKQTKFIRCKWKEQFMSTF